MRFSLLMIPAAIAAAASPAAAKVYLSVVQAQQILFPGARLTPQSFTLNAIQTRSVAGLQMNTHVWRVREKSGALGWFIVDQVEGKGDIITYAVALDAAGTVTGLEILECLSDYDTVRIPEWRAQFVGRKPGDPVSNFYTISGATLSSRHIAEGVRRILSTHAVTLR